MDFERLKFIAEHPLKVYDQHRVKEIRRFRKFGKNPDIVYYVIRCDLENCGLFAIFMYVLDHIAYATDQGYVPVLDSKRYHWLYQEKEKVNGTKDPWKYYFQPISKNWISTFIDKNVIYGAVKFPRYKGIYYYRDKEKNVLPDKEQIRYLHGLKDRYIHFVPAILDELEEAAETLRKFKRVLGIHVRGTDMNTAGKQHPIPTKETKNFDRVDAILKKHELDGIFLCTDEEEIVDIFQEYYGDKVLVTDAVRQKKDRHVGVHMDKNLGEDRTHHKYLLGKEVLKDMYLLSKCNVLLCGASNVAYAAIIYNNNQYDEIYYCV